MSSRGGDPSDSDELGTQASRALVWSLANTALSRLGTVGIGIALARLLGPEEFGSFAVATVALLAILAFNELGVSLAIVRWRDDPHKIAPTVTTIAVAMSVVLFVASWFSAPAFARAMGDPSATDVIRMMCVCIPINGIVASPAALMQRAFMQRQRMVIDQVNVWVGAFLSIALVVAGWGAMSLAIGRVVGTVLAAALFIWWAPGRLRFGLDPALIQPLLKFGLPLAGASVLVFAAGYADQLVAGTMLGPTQLGFYVLAFNLASWPVALLSQPLRSVAPAAFARLQHDSHAMGETFRSVTSVLAIVALPSCLLLAGAAEPIVRFVYGADWAPAATALRWLALLAALRIMFELAYDYLVVRQRSGAILAIQGGWLIVSVPFLILGAHLYGIAGIAAAQVAVALVVAAPLYAFVLRRDGVDLSRLGRTLLLPAAAGVLVGVAAVGWAEAIRSPLLACLLAGLPALAVIAALLRHNRATVAELRSMRSVSEEVP